MISSSEGIVMKNLYDLGLDRICVLQAMVNDGYRHRLEFIG